MSIFEKEEALQPHMALKGSHHGFHPEALLP